MLWKHHVLGTKGNIRIKHNDLLNACYILGTFHLNNLLLMRIDQHDSTHEMLLLTEGDTAEKEKESEN